MRNAPPRSEVQDTLRRFFRLAHAPWLGPSRPKLCSLLATFLAIALIGSACSPRTAPHRAQRPADSQKAQLAKLKLPPPLPLPKILPAKVYVASPAQLEAKMRVALEQSRWSMRAELQEALASMVARNDAQRIASVWDLEQPWHYVALRGGIEIMAGGVAPNRKDAMQNWLSSLPPAGNFGARKLPMAPVQRGRARPNGRQSRARGQTRPQQMLIWTGPDQKGLYVAPSLRALVTAINLRGAAQPIQAVLTPAQLSPQRQRQLSLTREIRDIQVRGDLQNLTIDLKVDPSLTRPLSQFQLRAPPIPSLLGDRSLVWSGTTTWQGHQAAVSGQLGKVRRLVDNLPFLIRPTAEDLEARLGRTARQWDGRSFVGFDARQSLRVALGVKSLPLSEKATLGLIQAAIPNLALMRNFSNSVPSARLVQQRARSGDQKIHELILSDIAAHLPPDFHSLLSRRRQLHVAMSWSNSANALLLSIGPEAVSSMLSWVQASKNSEALFRKAPSNPTLQGRSTLAAMMLLHWLERPQSPPSIAELLRSRPASPRQDYLFSLSQPQPNLLHLDLKLDL